jgi:hypothetical protein
VRFCAQEEGDEAEFEQMVKEQSEGVEYEELERDESEEGQDSTGEGWMAKQQIKDAKMQAWYGVGYQLLEKMGWAPGAGVGRTCCTRNDAVDGAVAGRDVGDTRGLGRVDSDNHRHRSVSSG